MTINIIKTDAVTLLKSIPDQSVDLIFADPPYFLSNDGYTCKGGKRVSVNKGEWDRSLGAEKELEFYLSWLSESQRVLKDSGSIYITGTYHCIYTVGYAMKLLGFHVINDISYYKRNGSPNLSGRMNAAKHESIIWASPFKGKPLQHKFNYKALKSENYVLICSKCKKSSERGSRFCYNCGHTLDPSSREERQPTSLWDEIGTPTPCEKLQGSHPTQKAVKLLRKILLASSDEGDLILDPFLGSGTTALACSIMNRNFIGCDIDESYIELTSKRIINDQDVRHLF